LFHIIFHSVLEGQVPISLATHVWLCLAICVSNNFSRSGYSDGLIVFTIKNQSICHRRIRAITKQGEKRFNMFYLATCMHGPWTRCTFKHAHALVPSIFVFSQIKTCKFLRAIFSLQCALEVSWYLAEQIICTTSTFCRTTVMERSANDFTCIIHHNPTISKRTSNNTISLDLWDVNWYFSDGPGR